MNTPLIWKEILQELPSPAVVTLIGGGGKTGLLYYLVNHLNSLGIRAVAATTTKLSALRRDSRFIEIHSITEGCELLRNRIEEQAAVTLVYGKDHNNPEKMMGIPREWVDQLAQQFPQSIFLVEGDGSAGRSLKGHLSHEPVIPASTRLVIPVIGIDILGAPLNSHFVHRPERVTQMTGAPAETVITTEMVLQLLFHSEGYLSQCPPNSQVLPFINKVEDSLGFRQAQQLAEGILSRQHAQIQNVVVGSLARQEFFRVMDTRRIL
ncbi:selenium cofactor biosynthesis protein YqeC [Desulforamulus aeronauticus]|uniref:Probable selenium-dependent hydroxylase accessory protein YqeC n=1 Tax=Desulforamulus aeronauticus DSM 10349 TaxID=1121421 RepID=A0A1M6NZV9_9FIRM|nr:selenium cofactor biosynthesis protein YqeC [Desulforamulus aeronauticus]SHK01255.1 probable selenium-dependent hydroxylase accessory protein YqeC [Desulforamulus aeronauticus DSM 10349]